MDWNPELCEQFLRYRERPANDLLAAMLGLEPRLVMTWDAPDDHGVTLYPFRRLFVAGVAAA